jgi:hypothetical protein
MRIVLPYCRDVPHGFYWDFLEGLGEAIAERGDVAVRFPMAKAGEHDAEEMAALLSELERGCDLFLDLCSWGYGLTRMGVPQPSSPPVPLLDACGVTYVGMLFDQPYFQPINAVCAKRLFATFPDLGHREQAELVFPDLALSGHAFAPPAVRATNARVGAERDIDVLYFGNLDLDALRRPWKGARNEAVCEIAAGMVDAQPERAFHLAVKEALQEQSSAQRIGEVVGAIELYARSKFRHDVVAALAGAGIRMLVVGRNWDRIALPANVERRPPLAYEEMFRLAGRSRICIDASTYLSGANDRVFNYALNGAVCFTNAAGYLGKADWLRFYSMRGLDALAGEVRALLAEPHRLRDIGEHARDAVLARHRWRDRLAAILAATSSPSSSPPRAPAP